MADFLLPNRTPPHEQPRSPEAATEQTSPTFTRKHCVGLVLVGLFVLLNGSVPFLAGLGLITMNANAEGYSEEAQRVLLLAVGGLFIFFGVALLLGSVFRCIGALDERRTQDVKALTGLGLLFLFAIIFNVAFGVELRKLVYNFNRQPLVERVDQGLKVGVIGLLAFAIDAALWELARRIGQRLR